MARTFRLLIAAVALIGACGPILAEEPEKEVRDLVIAFNEAYLRNELSEYFSYYADDATLWFNSGRVALDTYRQDWHKLIEEGGGVEMNNLSDIRIQMSPSGDAAIATYLLEVQTRYPDGSLSKEQSQESDVWFRIGESWRVTHVHYTVRSGE